MAPNNPDVLPLSIEALQAQDKRNNNNEVSPDKQTLNDVRVLNFLQRNGITADHFTLEAAINLTGEGKTATEARLNSKLNDAKRILTKSNHLDVMDEINQSVVASKLENWKTPPENLSASDAAKIMQGWEYYNLLRDHVKRLLGVKDAMAQSRKEVLTETKGLGDTIQEKLGVARENWDKLSTTQKLAMAGAALLGGVMFFKSTNETISGIRDTLMTGLKVVGAGWLLNKVWYLFTGESMVDAALGAATGTKGSKFLMDAFHTDEKGAELMSKAFVQLGESPFTVLLAQYNEKKNTIEGTNMPADEAYKAFDLFVKKYGADHLKQLYANYKPPISFSQVAVIEMSKDPDVKMQEALTSRIYEGVSDQVKKGYNYLAASAPGVWLAKKYKDWFGKDPTPEQMQDFTKKFSETATDDKDFNKVLEEKLFRNDKKLAKSYVDTNLKGKADAKFGLKYRAEGNYIYMIVDKPITNAAQDEKAVDAAVQAAIESSENFLVEQYKADKDTVAGQCEPHGTIFVASTGTLRYMVRYKKK